MKKIIFIFFIVSCFVLFAQEKSKLKVGDEIILSMSTSLNRLDKTIALEAVEKNPGSNLGVKVLSNIIYTKVAGAFDYAYLKRRALSALCKAGTSESQEIVKDVALTSNDSYILSKAVECLGDLDPSDFRVAKGVSRIVSKALYAKKDRADISLVRLSLVSIKKLVKKGGFNDASKSFMINAFYQLLSYPLPKMIEKEVNDVLKELRS